MSSSSSNEGQTMHNIDVVQRILEYFLLYEQQQQQKPALLTISKLLDSYLAEIARDPKLSVTKFQFIAQCLPENARTCDDGLYRAIDTYLKVTTSKIGFKRAGILFLPPICHDSFFVGSSHTIRTRTEEAV